MKVPEPTRWWSKLGHGDLQVCLDPTDLNKAVLREYHIIPVVEDIVPDIDPIWFGSVSQFGPDGWLRACAVDGGVVVPHNL